MTESLPLRREAYLIRHGETEWNVQKRWQGTYDVPLNAEGERQALLLAEYMRQNHRLDYLYSSDLTRAWKTAEMIGKLTGVTPIADTRLREFNVGLFQGYSGVELEQLYPQELAAYRRGGPIPQGESREDVQERALSAWEDITAKTTGNVALVAHGGWIAQFLMRLFPEMKLNGVPQIHNTSITTLVKQDNTWVLESISVTPHL
ncbi:MAG TPA: histidine phosphatase family protein [Phototrophicaceae bacterium]|jgi:broad specificity phosphatase PhoE|nr:histidine phosphatase family protein [Phototrophicaceae bacterium]